MSQLSKRSGMILFGLAVLACLPLMACGGTQSGASTQSVAPQSAVAVRQATSAAVAPTAEPATPLATTAPAAAPATAAPVEATQAPAPTAPAPVDVTIALTEFKVESSLTTFQAGVPYHFTITNSGKIQHEINLAFVNTALVPVGETKTLDVTFADQGSQEFACHLGGHYEAGMKLPVTVGP